jgi:S1-C subfamily serine protease
VLKQAGLKTGDVVKDVNGRKIHNIFQAVGAYFTLRKEKDFLLHVDRKGQVITLRYRVDHGAARNATPMAGSTAQ